MDDRALRYWIGFNRTKGIGPVRLRTLIEHFGSIEAAWKASPGALEAAGLDRRTLNSLLSTRKTCDLDAELRAVEHVGSWLLTIEDSQYPTLLRQIPDAPPLLYVRGTLKSGDNQAIAIVGTRRATTYGRTMAHNLSYPLAQRGITIVSGLARGIDETAHQAALEAGGRTIAVMANGIDTIYPPENRELAEKIAAHGALITELPIGSVPERRHFMPRNRIVSGLCMGTIVVEAAAKSGALMTADLALEQGREVFAVPGNAVSPTSKGTNALIQTGAKMVTSVEDVVEELTLSGIAAVSPASVVRNAAVQPVAENETEAVILRQLSLAVEPQSIDDLAHQVGLPVNLVSSTLTILEMKEFVRQVGIMQYMLSNRLSM